jgi:hypothetical protein
MHKLQFNRNSSGLKGGEWSGNLTTRQTASLEHDSLTETWWKHGISRRLESWKTEERKYWITGGEIKGRLSCFTVNQVQSLLEDNGGCYCSLFTTRATCRRSDGMTSTPKKPYCERRRTLRHFQDIASISCPAWMVIKLPTPCTE